MFFWLLQPHFSSEFEAPLQLLSLSVSSSSSPLLQPYLQPPTLLLALEQLSEHPYLLLSVATSVVYLNPPPLSGVSAFECSLATTMRLLHAPSPPLVAGMASHALDASLWPQQLPEALYSHALPARFDRQGGE